MFQTQVYSDNPNVTSGNVCPTLVVWGVPTMFFKLGTVLK